MREKYICICADTHRYMCVYINSFHINMCMYAYTNIFLSHNICIYINNFFSLYIYIPTFHTTDLSLSLSHSSLYIYICIWISIFVLTTHGFIHLFLITYSFRTIVFNFSTFRPIHSSAFFKYFTFNSGAHTEFRKKTLFNPVSGIIFSMRD